MKNLIIAMLLCMVGVGFVGCSSNNDDEPTEQYTFQKSRGVGIKLLILIPTIISPPFGMALILSLNKTVMFYMMVR